MRHMQTKHTPTEENNGKFTRTINFPNQCSASFVDRLAVEAATEPKLRVRKAKGHPASCASKSADFTERMTRRSGTVSQRKEIIA